MKSRVLVAVVGLLGAAFIALGADTGRNHGVVKAGAANAAPVSQGKVIQSPHDFGTSGDSVSTFHFSSFRPLNTSFTFDTNLDAIWPTSSGSVTIFDANLQVPEGAIIDFVVMDFCKTDTSIPGIVFGGGDNNSDYVDVDVPGVSGCFSVSSPLIGHAVTMNEGHRLELFINWETAPLDGSTKLAGGEVWWHRTVSTGPVTPDFLDVPASDPRYNYIEAIFQAGVTVGCGGGNYCPDTPVTRGQMAVFLAKTLGLYWPNGL